MPKNKNPVVGRINIRQQKYKKNRLLGMNCYNAARSAGYSEAVAKSHTKELEERLKIADIFDRQGLTDRVLVAKHKELLEAHRVMVIDGKVLDVENGGVKIPELFIQIKALELAYKLKKHLEDGGGKNSATAVIINIRNSDRLFTSAQAELVSPKRSEI